MAAYQLSEKLKQEYDLNNTYDSFIPSTIRQWNSLVPSLRNVDSIAKFKAELRKRKDISQVPKHYETAQFFIN
jgi:hypothetical protein